MNCERTYCNGRELVLDDEYEINRLHGNNYDIVIYEQRWSCPRCSHEIVKQESMQECVDTMDYTTDDLYSAGAPARFAT